MDKDVETTIYSDRPDCALITLTQSLSRDGISPANSYSFRLHNVSAANLRSWAMIIIIYLDACADHFGTVPDVDSKNASDHE